MHNKWVEAIELGLHTNRPKLPAGWAQVHAAHLLGEIRQLPSAAQETALIKWKIPFAEWPSADGVSEAIEAKQEAIRAKKKRKYTKYAEELKGYDLSALFGNKAKLPKNVDYLTTLL